MLYKRPSRGQVALPGPTSMATDQSSNGGNAITLPGCLPDASTESSDVRKSRFSRLKGSRPLPSPSTPRKTVSRAATGEIRVSATFESQRDRTEARSANAVQEGQSFDKPQDAGSTVTQKPSIDRSKTNESVEDKVDAGMRRLPIRGSELEEMDPITKAAKEEAEELVYKHQYPHAPYRVNPSPCDSSQTSSQPFSQPALLAPVASGKVDHSDSLPAQPPTEPAGPTLRKQSSYSKIAGIWGPMVSNRRKSSGKRSASGKHKTLFANPEDRIYEDPEEKMTEPPVDEQLEELEAAEPVIPPAAPIHIRKNPFARIRAARESSADAASRPYATPAVPGSVSGRQLQYRKLERSETDDADDAKQPVHEDLSEEPEETKYKNGVEVRSDDLRAATSFRRSDRSSKLPSPTGVSDSAMRPTVSFKPDWTPPKLEEEARKQGITAMSTKRPSPIPQRLQDGSDERPIKSASAPAVPTINHPHATSMQFNNGRLVSPPPIPERSKARPTNPPISDIPRVSISPIPTIRSSNAPQAPLPSFNISPAPSTNFPPVPSISVSEPSQPSIPSISISTSPEPETYPRRPIPTIIAPSQASQRPRPHPSIAARSNQYTHPKRPHPPHAHTTPLPMLQNPHWRPTSAALRRTTALCAQCALPISGKIVTAAGTRFHPDCFVCHTCSTPLECVAFYPEPDEKRSTRLNAAAAAAAAVDSTVPDADADSDDSLRFYCHLDFHELFSPRCKSCKTPIEGEVVVACGAEWHVGHFFCAECGDPFDPSTPFVERDGYAWCVGCHTRRFSGKCAGCRRPVVERVLQAEGSEWHVECFVCAVCESTFDDGRYYMVGESQVPICSGCQDRRLKE